MQAGREVYTRLRTLLGGTPRDHLRANAVANYRMWNAISDCMAEQGWDYHVMPYVVGGRLTRPGPPGDLTAWAEPSDDFGIAEMAALAASEGFIADGRVHPLGNEGLSAADEAGWIAAMNGGCSSAGTAMTDGTYPTGVTQTIGADFTALLTDIQSTPRAQSLIGEWASCMDDHGFDVHTKHGGYDGTELWPGFRLDTEGREIAGARADAACRRPLHEHVLADGAEALAAFEADRAEEIAAAAEEWRGLRAEADEVLAANR
ncbi:hypothetical protein AB0I28_23665 [Phytomonospora sp. NPDC050363]|uniref:hypothetical protein n=1 Tax=Phytomonospora sp. NPDC050363 TaxID=3155642 RepID=UPI0033FE7087